MLQSLAPCGSRFFWNASPWVFFFLVIAKCRICIFALSVVFAGRLWHPVFFQSQKGLCMFWMDTSAVSFFGLCSGFEFQSTDLTHGNIDLTYAISRVACQISNLYFLSVFFIQSIFSCLCFSIIFTDLFFVSVCSSLFC